jgi:hypothetical protein
MLGIERLGIAEQYLGELRRIGCDPPSGPQWYQDRFPRLVSGMIVHVHDVFLPDEYPKN